MTFSEDSLTAIAEKAIDRKTGARGLRSIVENMLLDSMYEVPDMDGIAEVKVTGEMVKDGKKPEYIMGEKKKKEEKLLL